MLTRLVGNVKPCVFDRTKQANVKLKGSAVSCQGAGRCMVVSIRDKCNRRENLISHSFIKESVLSSAL